MSAKHAPARPAARLAILLVALYPEAWRRRYREEMLALLADDPPGPRGLLSLVTGAAAAHLRTGTRGPKVGAADRMRLAIGGLFACWIALSLAGATFAKETEDPAFGALAAQHPLLAVCRGAIIAGACLGCAALAVGGLPLLWHALRRAVAERDLRLGAWLALPALSLCVFALCTGLAVVAAPDNLDQRSTALKLAILVPWWTVGLGAAAACAAAPRGALRRSAPPERLLRLAACMAAPLLAAMAVVGTGLLAYTVALAANGPGLSAQSGGPIWPSTGAMLGAASFVALGATGLAAIGATRALIASRAVGG